MTYTWQFYGETAERALTEAIEWCEVLRPPQRTEPGMKRLEMLLTR